jgi:hypothetical protein
MSRERRGAMGTPQASGAERGGGAPATKQRREGNRMSRERRGAIQ